jgi:hypothetical protein
MLIIRRFVGGTIRTRFSREDGYASNPETIHGCYLESSSIDGEDITDLSHSP